MKIIKLLFFTLAISFQGLAQEDIPVDTSLLIEDVIIQQNRFSLPISDHARFIQVIGKKEIENLPVTNIPELLQYSGAIDIRRRGVNGVQSDAGIRGSTFNQVLILINGVRMTDPQTGHRRQEHGNHCRARHVDSAPTALQRGNHRRHGRRRREDTPVPRYRGHSRHLQLRKLHGIAIGRGV